MDPMAYEHPVPTAYPAAAHPAAEHTPPEQRPGATDTAAPPIRRAAAVIAETDMRLRAGDPAAPPPWATGFTPLDGVLAGGVRPGELILLAGAQGLGKTTFALQVARQILRSYPVLYVCYEHDAMYLMQRMLAAEAGEQAGVDAMSLRDVRSVVEGDGSNDSLSERLSRGLGGAEALAGMADRLAHLYIVRGGFDTDAAAIAAAALEVRRVEGQPPFVVVDYVQKVYAPGEDEEIRMLRVAGALKDLALSAGAPVLAITASDAEGIATGSRLRTQHFRGASALAYEADAVLVLNEKFDVVARHHLMYGANNADRFRNFAVLTVEKNRGGVARVDLQFRKRFEQARFERDGSMVEEQLVDERVYVS